MSTIDGIADGIYRVHTPVPPTVVPGGFSDNAHGRDQRAQIERLAATAPRVLAFMHGHAWKGDGASLLRQLAAVVRD